MTDRILGIDYGDTRTGLAVSDALGWTAQPIETFMNKNRTDALIERIKQIIQEYKITTVVYGLPRNMNGTYGPRSEATEKFIDLLKAYMADDAIKYIAVDERLTSVIAHSTMNEMGIKRKKKKGLVDQLAAVQILQSYLDSHR